MDSPAPLTSRQIVWFMVFCVCYEWSGIDGMVVNPRISFLIRNDLHASVEDLARFGQIIAAVGIFSLLFGFLRDRWPWGDRRLLLLEIPFYVTIPLFLFCARLTYGRLLGCMAVATVSSGMMTASFNGTLATMGRRLGAAGRLVGAYTAVNALIAAGGQELGGALASRPFSLTLLLVSLFSVLLFLLVFWPPEGAFPPQTRSDSESVVTPRNALLRLARCRPYQIAILYSLVWNFTPAYWTPLTVRLQDVVGLTPGEFAHYGAIGELVGVFGGLAFVLLASRFSPRAILTWGPVIYLPLVFLLFFLRTPRDAYVMIGATCLVSSALNAATFALVLRTVPVGLEGTGLAFSATLGVLLDGQGDVWSTFFSQRYGFYATVWVTILLVLLLPPLARLVPKLEPES
jgi:MFS family permease